MKGIMYMRVDALSFIDRKTPLIFTYFYPYLASEILQNESINTFFRKKMREFF